MIFNKFIKQSISVNVSFLLLSQPMLMAGEIVTDTSAAKSYQATVEKAQNNVPVVNIVAPNSTGLSHNKFVDYNVNKEGAILNNSNTREVNTQLAGYIYGNKNLAGGKTASTILNEVTSVNKTELKGFTEVAGDKASVVVANPNGIYINGAGFINTTKATLTTGNPNIKDGSIDNYRIDKGIIEVDGEGLNTTNVDKAELYSKVVTLNAKIHAKDIDIVTGKNIISKDGVVQKIDEVDNEKPQVSIDSSSLGGIYANKISLIGTQSGVGINLPIEITAQDDFKLNADGKITLDKVISQKSIDIKSDSSDVTSNNIYGNNIKIEAKNELNNNNIIASTTDINLKATKVINNNLIASGVNESLQDANNGNLNITSDYLENKNTIYAKDDLTISSKDIKNSESAINKATNINITSDDITNEDNVKIFADDTIDIKNSNRIIGNKSTFSAKDINITSNSLDYTNLAAIASNGNLAINTKLDTNLNNSYLESKNGLLNFASTQGNLVLLNSALIGNNINLNANSITTKGDTQDANSMLYSNNDININSNSYISTNFITQANNDVNITSSNISLDNSKIQTVVFVSNQYPNGYKQGNINLTTSNLNITNTSKLSSNDLVIKNKNNTSLTKMVINSLSTLQTNNNMTIDTKLLNATNVKFDSSNKIDIKTSSVENIFDNNSFTAKDLDLTVSDDDLELKTTNSFKTTNSLSIASKSLLNNTSLVSDGDIILKSLSGDIVNNFLISSNGLLKLDSGVFNVLNNQNGFIKGRKTLINTNTLTNKEFISGLESFDVNANNILNYGGIAAVNLDDESKKSVMTFNANNFTNYNTIYANGDINLNIKNNLQNITDNSVVDLGNESATIYATNNINIGNANQKTSTVNNLSANIETKNGDINIYANSFNNLSSNPEVKGVFIDNGSSKYINGGDRIFYNAYRDRGGYTYNYITTYTDTMSYKKPKIAQISSGKDIRFNTDTITNNYSLISAKDNLYFESNVLSNNEVDIVKLTTTQTDYYIGGKSCPKFRSCYEYSTYAGTQVTYDTEVIDKISSTIEAGKEILGSAKELINGNNNATITSQTYVPSIDINSKVSKTNLQTDIKSSNTSINPSPIDETYKLPTNKYGMFTPTDPNKNLNYLVELNPLYTNLANFTGSQYFLDKLNYKADRIVKKLGDAAYETSLVKDSIIKQTGQRFLADYPSENAQFVALMDNAVNVSGVLGLQFGKAPTAEQLSNLKENIVWMEEKIVEDQLVLVPVVYLANNYDYEKGAIITAQKGIDLKVKDALNNTGTIKSNDYITLTGKSITNNQGVILADGKTSLISSDDFINKNGGLIKASDVQIASINGNVINQTFTQTSKVQNGANDFTYTLLGKQSSIQSTNGNLVLQAKNNIENIGANLDASKTLSLNAQTGDVNFKTLSLENGHNVYFKGGFDKALDVQHLSSSANGENVVIKSGKDINLEAAKLNATNQINLNAANDVNILAVNDEHYKDVQTSSKGFLSKKTQRDMTYKENVVSGELNGKDIIINGTNNVTLQSAKLNSQDNLIANAQNGNLNIVAKEYKEGELHSTSKSSLGGLNKSLNISSSDAVKLKSADLISTNKNSNVVLTSGKDINVLASNINSAGNINLKAVDNVNIISQAQYDKKEEINQRSKFNVAGLVTLVDPMIKTSIYEKEVHNKDNANVTQISSNLNAGGNIVVNSGTTNIIGSNLEANNIAIKADTGSINVLSAKNTQTSSSLDKKMQMELSGITDVVKNDIKNITSGETKVKISVANASYDEDKINSNSTSNKASTLTARDGNVVLDALTDINVTGSNLKAKDTIALNSSVGDINISNSTDTQSKEEKEKHAKAELSVTVQNEYVEIVSAVKAALEATQQLKKVKDDYSKYKSEVKNLEAKLSQLQTSYKNKEVGVDYSDIEDLQDIIDNLKSQDKYYKAAIVAANADLASKSVAVATQAAAAAASSGTWGFSAGVSLDVNGSKTNTNSNSTTSNASVLQANNIFLQTNKELPNTSINVTGSNVIANENLNINTSNLNVIASQDTASQTQDNKSISGSVSYTMYGGGGGTAGLGYGQSNSNVDNLVNHNSTLQANNMNVNVSNDAIFQGATVRADTLNLNVGNNLNLESVRDEYSSNSKGFNVNAGIGFGSAGANSNRTPSLDVANQSSANAGFSVNNGTSLNKQTVLSSITANNLNVNVKGNTNLKGSLIASGNFDENNNFVDNKNLNFTTNTLSFENMSNTSYSSNQSIGLSANYNLEGTKIVDTKPVHQEAGISSASYNASNSLNVNASKTLATLGQGNINIKDTANSDDLSRLNTDTTKINKDLYSSSTGTKVDATLDTRLLSVEGRAQIKQEYKDLDKNMKTIADSLPNATSDNKIESVVGTIWDNVTAYETLGILPSNGNNGGVLGEIPILSGNKDSVKESLQVVSQNAPLYQQDSDKFMPIEQSDAYKQMSDENKAQVQGLYISKEPVIITKNNATYQNGGNGIMDDKGLSVFNVLEQTGMIGQYQTDKTKPVEATVFYNPSRGMVADSMETMVDLFGGTTGIAKQAGEFAQEVTTARGTSGSNFTEHSQYNLLTYSGIQWIQSADNTGAKFMPQEYYNTGKVDKDNRPIYNTPTFVSFGSPVNGGTLNTLISNKETGLGYTYKGAFTKSGDFVGEGLGGNSGANGQASFLDRINIINTIKLITPDSPHSSYKPTDYPELQDVTGYKK